jgi:hypothetical protein
MDSPPKNFKYYKEGANIVGWPDKNGVVEVLFQTGMVRRYKKSSHTKICKYTFSDYYEKEDYEKIDKTGNFPNISARDAYNFRKCKDSYNNPDYDGDYASDGYEIEWKNDYEYLNRIIPNGEEKFIPDEKDVNYPVFKGNPKNKRAVKKFNIECIFYEKMLIIRERSFNNLDYILHILKKGYTWDKSCFSWALEDESRIRILEIMLIRNQDPDADYDSDEWTPLLRLAGHSSYITKNKEIIKLLVMNGADIDLVAYRSNGSFRDQLETCEEEVQDDFNCIINPLLKSAINK